ncbi:MAG: prepilin-type N-terminal cleavage/methylation domain-containing protein [Candidatus Vogelbacteria bacterium]|nr:prepilin-type N-terminal cleavage/methylation domain-containing protein [Candidatus Vogelbacteria bacterium]
MLRPVPNRGFTLIEIMVAISIFTIVAVIAVGALITANRVNQKAQSIKLVMDNLNYAMESMTFKMRRGGPYYCGDDLLNTPPPSVTSQNCVSGGNSLAFLTPKSAPSPETVVYGLRSGKIAISRQGASPVDITSSAATITHLRFYVPSSSVGQVTIIISGYAQVGHEQTEFALQTTVSERI